MSGKTMRICFYTPNYPGVSGEGGIGSYVRRLGGELARLGHEVHVLTSGGEHESLDGLVRLHFATPKYIPVLDRMLPGTGACIRIGNAMRHLTRRFGIDVVEFPNWEGLAPWFAVGRACALVVRLHTSSAETIQIDGLTLNRQLRYNVRRERWTTAMADRLVTHSNAHRAAMAQELAISQEHISVISHGIEPVQSSQVPRDPATILFLGRLERRKGSIDLLDAAPIVLAEIPEARFIFIGADRSHCPGNRTHEQYLADEFPEHVQRQVRFAGRLSDPDVEHWLQRATVFCAPSLYESFGLVLLEAMRWGTPVIGTIAGGIPEIVEHGKSGLLVPPQRPRHLASAIISLLRDRDYRIRLGAAGKERCENCFSLQRMAGQTIRFYQTAIAARMR